MSDVRYSLLVDADKVNSINLDKPSLNQIGMCTIRFGQDRLNEMVNELSNTINDNNNG